MLRAIWRKRPLVHRRGAPNQELMISVLPELFLGRRVLPFHDDKLQVRAVWTCQIEVNHLKRHGEHLPTQSWTTMGKRVPGEVSTRDPGGPASGEGACRD